MWQLSLVVWGQCRCAALLEHRDSSPGSTANRQYLFRDAKLSSSGKTITHNHQNHWGKEGTTGLGQPPQELACCRNKPCFRGGEKARCESKQRFWHAPPGTSACGPWASPAVPRRDTDPRPLFGSLEAAPGVPDVPGLPWAGDPLCWPCPLACDGAGTATAEGTAELPSWRASTHRSAPKGWVEQKPALLGELPAPPGTSSIPHSLHWPWQADFQHCFT